MKHDCRAEPTEHSGEQTFVSCCHAVSSLSRFSECEGASTGAGIATLLPLVLRAGVFLSAGDK